MARPAKGPGIVTTETDQQRAWQVRYYAVNDRPVMVEGTGPTELIANALDLTSGAFVRDDVTLKRVLLKDAGVEELSEQMFKRLAQELRRSASYDRQNTAMIWRPTGDPEYPYEAELDNTVYILYSGNFPAEPMYSLVVDDQVVDSLDRWPHVWIRDDAS